MRRCTFGMTRFEPVLRNQQCEFVWEASNGPNDELRQESVFRQSGLLVAAGSTGRPGDSGMSRLQVAPATKREGHRHSSLYAVVP